MCLIHFQLHAHSNYKLILVANRDEFYDRPTAKAHFWTDFPNLLAGRDLQRMGTWLGITKAGRFAAITNYRDAMQMDSPRSRGEIVANYLKTDYTPVDYIEKLRYNRAQYSGFNLLVGTADSLYYYSNIENKMSFIRPGTHGLSNHLLNTPWPKVVKGKEKLKAYTTPKRVISQPKELFETISDTTEARDDDLPCTGVGQSLERKLSPQFIRMSNYGTRAMTILLVDKNDHVCFIEKTFTHGTLTDERKYTFYAR
ncbi:NRDE family protein [Virgibacillus sp. W0430]|uniref:NRDE family protein n=1 Tax=Virgibacillus sp. W0430 TaxID=3391580 RepID=UPI003F446D10